jgi:hypothetical protein
MIARRHSGIVCHSWTLLRGQPGFFPSVSLSKIPARNRSGHFFSGGGGTIVASEEDGVVEDIDSVSVSFSFLDFLEEEWMTISLE